MVLCIHGAKEALGRRFLGLKNSVVVDSTQWAVGGHRRVEINSQQNQQPSHNLYQLIVEASCRVITWINPLLKQVAES